MHINKLPLQDFGLKTEAAPVYKEQAPLDYITVPIALQDFTQNAAAQNNTPTHTIQAPKSKEPEQRSVPNINEDVGTETTQQLSAGVESGNRSNGHIIPEPRIDEEIIKQNQMLEASLTQIKHQLAAIEKAQDSRFLNLSQSVLTLVRNVVFKIFKTPSLATAVAEPIISHIQQVLSSINSQSKINIAVPNNLSDGVKTNLVDMLKNAAAKLNIEVIEHANDSQSIEVNWVEGKAEFQVDRPLQIIEEEVRKFNTSA